MGVPRGPRRVGRRFPWLDAEVPLGYGAGDHGAVSSRRARYVLVRRAPRRGGSGPADERGGRAMRVVAKAARQPPAKSFSRMSAAKDSWLDPGNLRDRDRT